MDRLADIISLVTEESLGNVYDLKAFSD